MTHTRGGGAAGAARGGATPEGAKELLQRLAQAIPEPRCELDFETPWQLLVATILSAQSTDARVNLVTPELFRHYPDAAALGAASQESVERLVKSTGFFRNKARAVREASRAIAEQHGGEVPRELDALLELKGVARKTANLVLGTALGIASGIVVDTHAARVAQRLGMTTESDPVRVERDLCALVPKRRWIDTGHRLVLHGRYVCTARAPRCATCPLAELCPAREGEPEGSWKARAKAEEARVASRGAEPA